MGDKVFLLCVGAPRCGTTWLHHYLHSFEEVAPGFKKEFHVFDAVYLPHCSYFATPPRPGAARQQPFVQKHLEEQARIVSFRNNHELYFDYFASLLRDDTKRISADISPSYLSLPAEVLALVADGFRKRDIETRVILLMRDPLERILSSCRLAHRLGLFEGRRIDRNIPFTKFLAEFARRVHVVENTQYNKAIRTIRSVFPTGRAYYGFFETMFREDEIDRLSNFIGVPPRPDLATLVHNQSTVASRVVDSDILAGIRDLYDEQYQACHAEFPDAGIPQIWRNFHLDERSREPGIPGHPGPC